MKKLKLVYDLDKTLCTKKKPDESYLDVEPIPEMINQLNYFYDKGYEIIISTARNMVTQQNHVSKVAKNVGLDTMLWLNKHGVKYHGLDWGKEYADIYIDDKSCINDTEEIQRRINSIENGNEEQYLKDQINLKKELNKLKNENKLLKEELKHITKYCLK